MKKLFKIRSGIAVTACARHGGPMRNKSSKRAKENKHPNFLDVTPATAIDEINQQMEDTSDAEDTKKIED